MCSPETNRETIFLSRHRLFRLKTNDISQFIASITYRSSSRMINTRVSFPFFHYQWQYYYSVLRRARVYTHLSTTPTGHNPTDFRARQMFDREMYYERSYRLFNDLFEHCRSKDQKNSRERRHSITDDTQRGKKKVGSVCGDEREHWKSDGKRQKWSDYTTDGKRYGIRSEKGGQNGMRSEVKKEQWRLVLKSDGTILLGKYAKILGFYSRVGLRK